MLATPFIDPQDDNNPSAESFGLKQTNEIDPAVKLTDDLVELDLDGIDTANAPKNGNRITTDLVRLYLQDIGRVPLLRRDEEVLEAQKVQRYIRLLELRTEAANKDNQVMQRFMELINAHDRLVSQLGHRPSLKRWAAAVGMDVPELKQTLSVGKRRWAEVSEIDVQELEQTQKAGIRAKEHMIKANLRLVVSVAKKYQNRGLELLDLIQEGTLGLERAVEKFDPTKGYRFSTYAYWWIRQGITRAIATQSRTIRLPVHITEKLNKIKKAQRKISQEKGRTATVEDIAKELEMTPPQVRSRSPSVSTGSPSFFEKVGCCCWDGCTSTEADFISRETPLGGSIGDRCSRVGTNSKSRYPSQRTHDQGEPTPGGVGGEKVSKSWFRTARFDSGRNSGARKGRRKV